MLDRRPITFDGAAGAFEQRAVAHAGAVRQPGRLSERLLRVRTALKK